MSFEQFLCERSEIISLLNYFLEKPKPLQSVSHIMPVNTQTGTNKLMMTGNRKDQIWAHDTRVRKHKAEGDNV